MGGNHLRGLDVNGKVILKLTVKRDFENVDCTQLADQWRDCSLNTVPSKGRISWSVTNYKILKQNKVSGS